MSTTTQKFRYEGIELDTTLSIGEDGVQTPKRREFWRDPLLAVLGHLTGYSATAVPMNTVVDGVLFGFGLTRDSKFAHKLNEKKGPGLARHMSFCVREKCPKTCRGLFTVNIPARKHWGITDEGLRIAMAMRYFEQEDVEETEAEETVVETTPEPVAVATPEPTLVSDVESDVTATLQNNLSKVFTRETIGKLLLAKNPTHALVKTFHQVMIKSLKKCSTEEEGEPQINYTSAWIDSQPDLLDRMLKYLRFKPQLMWSKSMGLCEEHMQQYLCDLIRTDGLAKHIKAGYEISILQLVNFCTLRASSQFRGWAQDGALQASRGARTEKQRTMIAEQETPTVACEDNLPIVYGGGDDDGARHMVDMVDPVLLADEIEERNMWAQFHKKCEGIIRREIHQRASERYVGIYRAYAISGLRAREIAEIEGVSENRASTMVQTVRNVLNEAVQREELTHPRKG